MQLSHIILALASSAVALAAPATDNTDAAQSCKSGFSIQTFGSGNCGQFSQGISNSGTGCNVCVQMGNAQSWKIINPDHCRRLLVSYHHGAGCGDNVVKDITYNTAAATCNAILNNIGNHFSARFVCLD